MDPDPGLKAAPEAAKQHATEARAEPAPSPLDALLVTNAGRAALARRVRARRAARAAAESAKEEADHVEALPAPVVAHLEFLNQQRARDGGARGADAAIFAQALGDYEHWIDDNLGNDTVLAGVEPRFAFTMALSRGASARTERAAGAPAGAAAEVASMSLPDKVLGAVLASGKYLGPELADKIRAALTPDALAMLVGTVVLGASAQFIPIVGQAIDVALVGIGIACLGLEGIHLVKEGILFVKGALAARSQADLDEAGAHLARFVAAVGIDVAIAFLCHRAMKSATKGAAKVAETMSGDMGPPTGLVPAAVGPEYGGGRVGGGAGAAEAPVIRVDAEGNVLVDVRLLAAPVGTMAMMTGGDGWPYPDYDGPSHLPGELQGAGPEHDAMGVRGKAGAGMADKPRHHVFPQEMRTWFREHGFKGELDIDEFTVEMTEAEHQALHGGGNWKLGRLWPGEWNSKVQAELLEADANAKALGGELSQDAIFKIVFRLMDRDGIPRDFRPYRQGSR